MFWWTYWRGIMRVPVRKEKIQWTLNLWDTSLSLPICRHKGKAMWGYEKTGRGLSPDIKYILMLILDFLASGTVRNKISFLSYQVHDISLQAKAGDLQIRLPYIHGFSTFNSRCHMTGTMGLRREFGIDEEKYGSWSAVSKTE